MNAFWQYPRLSQDTGGVDHKRLSFSLQKENSSCSIQMDSVSPLWNSDNINCVKTHYKLLKVKPLRSWRARQKSCMLSLYFVILLEPTFSLLLPHLFVGGLMKHWPMVHLQTEPKHWWMMTDQCWDTHGYQAQQNPPWAAQLPLAALCRKGLEILHLLCGSPLRMYLRNENISPEEPLCYLK